MDERMRPKEVIEFLRGYSALARLGHDRERLTELAPQVIALFEALATLREIAVGGAEMAVTFAAPDDGAA